MKQIMWKAMAALCAMIGSEDLQSYEPRGYYRGKPPLAAYSVEGADGDATRGYDDGAYSGADSESA